jgi:D-alanyl-D-alanine dipeptidase
MRVAIALLTLLGTLFCTATTTQAQSFPDDLLSMRTADNKTLIEGQRLVVVITPDWNSVQGMLTRFELQKGKWQQIGDAFPVVVGKNGMAWDPSLWRHHIGAIEDSGRDSGPIKHEGDGRSPAGILKLTESFGFDATLRGVSPYLPLTESIECVDDPGSRYYAQIVDRQKMGDNVDWNSSEKMREVPGYRLGVVVDYNLRHTVPGEGSCIFFHQWSDPAEGTAGCTAMSAENIETLIAWLKSGKHATLAQFPKSEYEKLYRGWRLPAPRSSD